VENRPFWGKCIKKILGNLAYREMLFYKKALVSRGEQLGQRARTNDVGNMPLLTVNISETKH